jgi:hypothetical protein
MSSPRSLRPCTATLPCPSQTACPGLVLTVPIMNAANASDYQALARLYHESWEMGLQARIVRDRLHDPLRCPPDLSPCNWTNLRDLTERMELLSRERCTLILRLSFDIGH